MKNVKIRNMVGIVVGVIVSTLIIIVGEALVNIMNPGINRADAEAMKVFFSNAPVALHLMVLFNYALACFVGGLIASLIAADNKMNQAMSLGGIFMGVGMFGLISLSYPTWVIVFSVLVFLPFSYMGGLMSLKIAKKRKGNN